MIKSPHWDYRERLDGKVGAAGGLEQECRAEGVRVWRAQESGSAEQAGCELLCYLHRHRTLYEPPLTMKTQLSEMNRMWL